MLMLFLCILSEEDHDKIERIFKDHHLLMYRISLKMCSLILTQRMLWDKRFLISWSILKK